MKQKVCGSCEKQEPTDGPKFGQCSKCKNILYCSKQCQTEHWYEGHNRACTASFATTPEKVTAPVACSDPQCCSPPSLSSSPCSPCSPSEIQPRKRCPAEKQKQATEAKAAEKETEKEAKAAEKETEKEAKAAKKAAKKAAEKEKKTRVKEAETCAVEKGYDEAVRLLSIEAPVEGKRMCENSTCKNPHEEARYYCKDCGDIKRTWYSSTMSSPVRKVRPVNCFVTESQSPFARRATVGETPVIFSAFFLRHLFLSSNKPLPCPLFFDQAYSISPLLCSSSKEPAM